MVQTGPDGTAHVTLDLPENLTTWRATAVCVTDDTQVGMATAETVASKPVMVRIQAPRFMNEDDQQEVAVLITNNTGADSDFAIRLDASDVRVGEGTPKSVHVVNGATQKVPISVTALLAGAAKLEARVWSGARNDGVRATFPVNPRGRLVVDREQGLMETSTDLGLNLDPKANAD